MLSLLKDCVKRVCPAPFCRWITLPSDRCFATGERTNPCLRLYLNYRCLPPGCAIHTLRHFPYRCLEKATGCSLRWHWPGHRHVWRRRSVKADWGNWWKKRPAGYRLNQAHAKSCAKVFIKSSQQVQRSLTMMSYRMMTLNTDSTLPGNRQAVIYLPCFSNLQFLFNFHFSVTHDGVLVYHQTYWSYVIDYWECELWFWYFSFLWFSFP